MGINRFALTLIAVALYSFSAGAQQTQRQQGNPPATLAPQQGAVPQGQQSQSAQPPGAEKLPEVEVIQKQPEVKKPAPKTVVKKAAPPPPQPAPVTEAAVPAPESTADARANGEVVPMSPLSGAELPVSKYISDVSTVSKTDLERESANTAQDVLQKHVPGVIVSDVAGSNFKTQVEYRGFTAGAVNGFPQGLAVYQNGVRVNEVFGDVVNWDLIPSNAINVITVLSGNPVYGLNAIGGGVSVLMKDGFGYQRAEIDALAGSFGREQVSGQAGARSGSFAAYWAGQWIDEDGWRDFSPAEVKRMYADLGAKGSFVEAHANLTWADTSVAGITSSPEDILNVSWDRTFTSPQVTDLELLMPTFSLAVKATDTLTFSGVGYYRRYKSNVLDANLLDAENCGLGNNDVCDANNNPLLDQFGNVIQEDAIGGAPFGTTDRIKQKAESWGGSVQAVEKAKLFGLGNQFLVGASYDRGSVHYSTSSEPGHVGPLYVVSGSGFFLSGPDDFIPRSVDADTVYVGVYFSDTLDLTDALSLTVGGRYNHAQIDLLDLTGDFPDITSSNTFERFNPSGGLTYKFFRGLSVYGGYSEANRNPTPAELGCANPVNPCVIESFLTDDPPLKQVVNRTWEAGFRGESGSLLTQKFTWNAGYFHALNSDDILFVSSPVTGRGFFVNGGDTLRQGVEIGAEYETKKFSVYGNYSYVRATFETANELSSPNNPLAVPCTADPGENCINVTPGDHIPGIPEHRFKTGFDYWLTPKWKFGTDLIAATGQYHLGDESNLLPKVGGYTRVDLHTSYDITDHIQIYGLVNNVFDQHYGLFGNLFDTEQAKAAGAQSGYAINDPRGIVPAAPVAAYGGVKVKF